jgi:hypothetical protein
MKTYTTSFLTPLYHHNGDSEDMYNNTVVGTNHTELALYVSVSPLIKELKTK